MKEIPINVGELIDNLYKVNLCSDKLNSTTHLDYVEKCGNVLRVNISNKKIDHFLSQIKIVFLDNDFQFQMLLIQFLKDYLSKLEIINMKDLLMLTSDSILRRRLKCSIIQELA